MEKRSNLKNIAIVAGGYSSEAVVSLKSAQGIYSFIDKEKYNVYIVYITRESWIVQTNCHCGLDPQSPANYDGIAGQARNDSEVVIDKNDFSFTHDGKKIKFDFAYITIHGTPGENGLLQGYLDMLNVPYSCCGVLAASLTFNKFYCNHYLNTFGVKTAKSVLLRKGETKSSEEIIAELGLPVFVKPNDGGSSFGTNKVKDIKELQPAIAAAFNEGQEVIIESFMPGTEVTCGCYKVETRHATSSARKSVVFPITEVVSKNEFFDYNAKYNMESDEITPARISDALTNEIQELTAKIYDWTGAKGIIRVDYIISPDNVVRMLEVNTTPGMTATSFIPQQVRAAGLNITDVMTEIIEN
ncbi:D-alanine--D-alanine ligase [Bacteroidia bacterium]|nr:D-alanine--D-alanine ligase [Bacteroidia bacterium]